MAKRSNGKAPAKPRRGLFRRLVRLLPALLDIGVLRAAEPGFWLKDPLDERLSPEQRGAPPLQMPRDEPIPPHQFIEPQQ